LETEALMHYLKIENFSHYCLLTHSPIMRPPAFTFIIADAITRHAVKLRVLFWLGITAVIAWPFFEFGFENKIFKLSQGDYGKLSWSLLVATIFIGLASKILACCPITPRLLPFRKDTGLAAALFASLHALAFFAPFGSLAEKFNFIFNKLELLLGLIAIIILIIFALTSNRASVKFLGGQNWKNLHRLMHAAFILVALHFWFLKHDSEALILLGIYVAGYAIVWGRKLFGWKTNCGVSNKQ
jgi:DMSO/TMAO reductase YedYZ heme-binding membrane subunit